MKKVVSKDAYKVPNKAGNRVKNLGTVTTMDLEEAERIIVNMKPEEVIKLGEFVYDKMNKITSEELAKEALSYMKIIWTEEVFPRLPKQLQVKLENELELTLIAYPQYVRWFEADSGE
jgi:hypothetical protein